jgi:hypothetical protein
MLLFVGLGEPDVSKYRSSFIFSSIKPSNLSILLYSIRTQKINLLRRKIHLRTGHEGSERNYRYSSTLSLTSALAEMGGQHE